MSRPPQSVCSDAPYQTPSTPAPKVPLRACPYCGSTSLMVIHHPYSAKDFHPEITCKSCGAGAGDAPTLTAAVEKWNQRNGCQNVVDLPDALPISVIVFGMMHKIPTDRLLKELERRGVA